MPGWPGAAAEGRQRGDGQRRSGMVA
uniref:Uncharacterized protein n=1 Tax=Arundo donax TaxID=35708 RepID=A0A0A8XPE6_ARUDO